MIQSSANPVLERLGMAGPLGEAGGVRTTLETWTEMGWVAHPGPPAGAPPTGRNPCGRRAGLDPPPRATPPRKPRGEAHPPPPARTLCFGGSAPARLLRATAAETPGVEAMLGRRVTGLLSDEGAARGVTVGHTGGSTTRVRAALVVGADGRGSTVAELAQVP